MTTNRFCRASIALTAALALFSASARAQTLTWIGTLGGAASRAHSVSDDGSRLAGFSLNTAGEYIPIAWSAGSLTDLGDLGGEYGWSLGMSGNGNVVVGFSGTPTYRPFRWSAGVMTAIDSAEGQASGASHDGSTISGWLSTVSGRRAFLWSQATGVQDIGTLGGMSSWAKKVSDDGLIAVGRADNASGRQRAFRWTAAGGMQDLGSIGGSQSDANSISPDGSVIVGWTNGRAFKWTAAGGMQDISGTLGISAVNSASNNGAVLVGWAHFSATRDAILWSGAGAQNMNTLFASLLSPGSKLWDASDISPNGRYIVGYGWNGATQREEGYILDTVPAPSTLVGVLAGVVLPTLRRRS